PRRRATQRERNSSYRADVGGDVLSPHTVPAGRTADQPPIFVRQGDAQPIDLQFGHVRDRLFPSASGAPDSLLECAPRLFVVGLSETEDGGDVLDGRKALGRTAGNALGWRIRRHEIWVLGFEPFELVEQPIEFFVGNIRSVMNVITLFVVTDLGTELSDAG